MTCFGRAACFRGNIQAAVTMNHAHLGFTTTGDMTDNQQTELHRIRWGITWCISERLRRLTLRTCFLALGLAIDSQASADPTRTQVLPALPKWFELVPETVFSAKDLDGKWKTPCRNYGAASYEVDLDFRADRLTLTEREYAGKDCKILQVTRETLCSFRIHRIFRDTRNGGNDMAYMQLTPSVLDVHATLHTEDVKKSGRFMNMGRHFTVGERRRVTGMATAVGSDFAEGFPQRGETPETWTSLPFQLTLRLSGPHEPVQLNREMFPSGELGFVRPGAAPPIRPKSFTSFGRVRSRSQKQ